VKPDSTVTVRNITTGITEADVEEVTSGLQPGDEVVMTGVDKLLEGSKVTVQLQGGRGGAAGAPGTPPPAGSKGLTTSPNSLPKKNSGTPARQGGRSQ